MTTSQSLGKTLHKILMIVGLTLASACGGAKIDDAKYAADQCRRINLVDADTGWRLRGIEDIATDAGRRHLFLSAYDRRAVEKAARKRASSLPSGGVYKVAVETLFATGDEELTLDAILSSGEIAGGLRPHGIEYDADKKELVLINRTYRRHKNGWRMTPTLQRVGANGEIYVGKTAPAHCAANDALLVDGALVSTFDHGSCNWRAGLEDVFRLKRSGVVNGKGETVFKGAAYANGLAIQDGKMVVAATREKSLIYLENKFGDWREEKRLDLEAAPDNLTVNEAGSVIAAVHPSLIRLALNRKLGIGKAPSRILEIKNNGETAVLFDEPHGKTFSAATVGVDLADGLVLGSVTDQGLLVCKKG